MLLANSPGVSFVEEDPMKPETKQVAKAVGAAVAGAAVGFVAGTLTAPARGSETRRKIARRIEDEAEALTRKAKNTMNDAKAKVADAIHG
jgi:gas vesicle protein